MDLQVMVPMLNTYFDTSDYSVNPMKPAIKFFYLSPNPYTAQIYYIKTQFNYAIRSSSWVSNSLEVFTDLFITTKFDYMQQSYPEGELYPYIALALIMDDETTTISRMSMTILEALSNTGGIMGFVYVAVEYLIKGL